MTQAETASLLQAVRRSRDANRGVAMFLKRHPHIADSPEIRGLAIGVGRTPFPSIKGLKEGPFPVCPDRPFYDARLWESDEQKAWEEEMIGYD